MRVRAQSTDDSANQSKKLGCAINDGELEINERGRITRLHKGDCAFIRKDFSVQLTKQAYNGEQFKAIFLMFTAKFLHEFYNKMDKSTIP